MPLTVQREQSRWLLRMEGQITLTCAGELKQLLLEWRAARKNLVFDLRGVEEMDIPILQLLWVAAREGSAAGFPVTALASESAAAAARDSGFAQLPGFPVQE